MFLRYFFIFLIVTVSPCRFACAQALNRFSVFFDQYTDGTEYTKTLSEDDFGEVLWLNNSERMIMESHSLKVFYPANTFGTANTGAQFKVQLIASDEYTLEYRLKFSNGFDLSAKGGKLPGLAGGKANTGGNVPTGDGWSARYMWRSGGRLVLYLYHLDQPGTYGESFDLVQNCSTQKWYTLKQRIKVNSRSSADGVIQIWVDGEKKLDLKNIRLQLNDQAPVDIFYFSTFVGGSDSTWNLSTDGYIFFDDFSLVKTTGDPEDSTSGGGCFIATAAFGSRLEKHVAVLKQFRDQFLVGNRTGEAFVKWYCRYAPGPAAYIENRDHLKFLVRWMLIPVTGVAYVLLKLQPIMLLSVLLVILFLSGVFVVQKMWLSRNPDS